MTTEEKTEEQSYPQMLLARARDRQRSFLRRSAWMLGYILLVAVVIFVEALFKELWKTHLPEKSEEPLLYDHVDDEFLILHDFRRNAAWNRKIPRDL